MNGAAAFRAAPFGALWLCYFATVGLFSPYLPLWLSALGYSTLAIGGFAALQSWVRVLTPYAWGWLADRSGRRVTLLRVAAACSAVAAGALWWVRDAGTLALALVLGALFLSSGAVVPIVETLLLRHLHGPRGLDARRYGRVRLWGSVGFIASVLLFGVVLQRFGIGSLPLFACVLFVLLVLAVAGVPATADGPARAAERGSVWPVLRRPAVVWFFASTMLIALAHAALYAFFSLYLVELGYGKPTVGLLWALGVIAEVVFFATAGRFFARLADQRWLQWVALVSAARFALTAGFADMLPLLALLQLSHALTFGAQHLACTSVIARHFPDHLRARGSALYAALGGGVPGVVGGLAGGVVSQRFGLAAVFWAAAGAALIAAGCSAIAVRADNPQQ